MSQRQAFALIGLILALTPSMGWSASEIVPMNNRSGETGLSRLEKCETLLRHLGFHEERQSENAIVYKLQVHSHEEVDALADAITRMIPQTASASTFDWLKNVIPFRSYFSETEILSGSATLKKFLEDVWVHNSPRSRSHRASGEMNYVAWNVYTFERQSNGRIKRTILQGGEDVSETPDPSTLTITEGLLMHDLWDKNDPESAEFSLKMKIEIRGDLSILADLDSNLRNPVPLVQGLRKLLTNKRLPLASKTTSP